MLFVCFFTAHRFGWTNHNLLLFNPLCLLLLPGGWRIVCGRAPGPSVGRWLGVVAACTIYALFMLWLPTLPQRNAQWNDLLLPVPERLDRTSTVEGKIVSVRVDFGSRRTFTTKK